MGKIAARIEQETSAISLIAEQLDELEPDARDRVLDYLLGMYRPIVAAPRRMIPARVAPVAPEVVPDVDEPTQARGGGRPTAENGKSAALRHGNRAGIGKGNVGTKPLDLTVEFVNSRAETRIADLAARFGLTTGAAQQRLLRAVELKRIGKGDAAGVYVPLAAKAAS